MICSEDLRVISVVRPFEFSLARGAPVGKVAMESDRTASELDLGLAE